MPRTIQSGPVTRGGKTGKGNPYLKGALGEAAAASRQDRHLPRRTLPTHRQTPRQTQGPRAVARSILVIIWHLLTDPLARFHDLGSDYHNSLINTERRIRNHIAQLTAMGYGSLLEPAA